MGSEVISFRIPEDLLEEFKKKCEEEGITLAESLRKHVDDICYPPTPKPEASAEDSESASEDSEEGADETRVVEVPPPGPGQEEVVLTLGIRVEALEDNFHQLDDVFTEAMEKLEGRLDVIDKAVADGKSTQSIEEKVKAESNGGGAASGKNQGMGITDYLSGLFVSEGR